MLWKDLSPAAHGLKATVQYLKPMEEGMSLARQMNARVETQQISGTIDCPTYLDVPLLATWGTRTKRAFPDTAIVILKEP